MTMHIRQIAGAIAATAAVGAVTLALPATASAEDNLRGSVSFPVAPVVQCDGGVQIGLGFDVDYTFHWTYEADELVRERLTLRYSGWFENLATGARSVPVRGTGNTVVDFVDGTRTVSGSGRSMTMPGIGVVLQDAGHSVIDDATGELLVGHGPMLNEATPEGARLVCAAMGLTGGVPLAPPDVHD